MFILKASENSISGMCRQITNTSLIFSLKLQTPIWKGGYHSSAISILNIIRFMQMRFGTGKRWVQQEQRENAATILMIIIFTFNENKVIFTCAPKNENRRIKVHNIQSTTLQKSLENLGLHYRHMIWHLYIYFMKWLA